MPSFGFWYTKWQGILKLCLFSHSYTSCDHNSAWFIPWSHCWYCSGNHHWVSGDCLHPPTYLLLWSTCSRCVDISHMLRMVIWQQYGSQIILLFFCYMGRVHTFCVNQSGIHLLSPVYTRPLTQIPIRIKLTQVHVNALLWIAIRVT